MRLPLLFVIIILSTGIGLANNDIFPAEPAAENVVNWKDGYFYIKGKPTFLTSGEMHYARIPRDLWRDRIWRSKQMGFNCMQMYVFWNASEPEENKWDFTDNLDLDAWLSLVQEMGMYAVVRVGPYSCAEWEHGGIPAWLTAKEGMHLRDNDPVFLKYEDSHLAQVEAIVAKHQINHGGNVIMVQLENEHPDGWGTDEHNSYLKHLVEQARLNGLEIPLFLSGLHHGGEPSGESPYSVGASPWYTTEFWTGWIGRYGNMDTGMMNEKIRGTWKIIAFGGSGYDYYMVHGGTNFGYSGDTLQTTYDYSAPIGETGHFNNFYFPARRAAWFAQSFSNLLTGSHNDPGIAQADLPGVRVTSRTNPSQGSIVFVDNFGKKVNVTQLPEIAPSATAYTAPSVDKSTGSVSTRLSIGSQNLPEQGSLLVTPNEPSTVLLNIPWTDNATYSSVVSNVLFCKTIGKTDYWVCYGSPGNTGEIHLNRINSGPKSVQFTYPTDESIQEVNLDSGDGYQAKFLIINTDFTNKTWLVNDSIYFGPSFVLEDGSMEFPEPSGGQATIYALTGKSEVSQPPMTVADLPVLADWSWRDAATERMGNFTSPGWVQSQGPQQMALYASYQNSYAWYGTILHSDTGNPVALQLNGMNTEFKFGTFEPFLNGEPADLNHLNVKWGDNVLSILAKVSRRPKGWNFTGPVRTKDKDPQLNPWRGIWGPVLQDGQDSSLSTAPWFYHPGLDNLQETAIIGRVLNWSDFLNHSPWQSEPSTTPLPSFWKTTFTYHSSPGIRETLGLSIRKNGGIKSGHVWLNGHNLGEIPQNEPIYMPECWIREGSNDLVIFDMFGGSPKDIQIKRYEGFSLLKRP